MTRTYWLAHGIRSHLGPRRLGPAATSFPRLPERITALTATEICGQSLQLLPISGMLTGPRLRRLWKCSGTCSWFERARTGRVFGKAGVREQAD
jgi:hypothetical protein